MKSNEKQRIMPAILGIAFCGIMAICGRGIAQDTAATAPPPSERVQQILKPVESLINKNTFALAYINVKALDVDKSVANWKQLVTDLFTKIKADKRLMDSLKQEADMNLDAIQAHYFKRIDEDMPDFKAKFDALLKAGLKEMYILSNSRTMVVSPVRIVLTLDKNGSADELLAILEKHDLLGPNFHVEKRDGMLIVNPAMIPVVDNPSNKAKLQRMLDAVKPEANPAIIAGLERVKNAPIQVVFAPDPAIRGMMLMGLAAAPEPVNKFGGKTLNDGVQWASAGLEPMKQIFAMTIQSASPEAAQKLYDTINEVVDFWGKIMIQEMLLDKNISKAFRVYMEKIKVFIPQVKDDKLQLVVNKQFLETQAESLTAVGATLLPAITAANEASRRMQCTNNIKQIVLAMHTYHDANKMLPPVMTADANGKPLHSWRVLLLPYMEEQQLYGQIRLNEPWDSEYNKQFHNRAPRVYQCPSAKGDMTGMTSYSVVVGKECFFNEPNAKRGLGAIADGTSNTIAIVERKKPVCWMDPTQEIPFATAGKGINVSADGLGSNHIKGMNVGLFDGSVVFISEAVAPAVLRAMFTPAGGESNSLP